MASDNGREKRIREMMEVANMTRQEAEFAVAIEMGEVPGDVIENDDPDGADHMGDD